MGGVAVPGTAAEDETLAAARAALYAARTLSGGALERLELRAVPPVQVAAVHEAAEVLIDALSPIVSTAGDEYVDQVVGIARSLYGA